MIRSLAIVALAAGILASTAAARPSATDPRLCGGTAASCGRAAATFALRHAMTVRFADSGPGGWDAQIHCIGSSGFLRFRCSFSNAAEKGWAVVTFAPKTWKATVVVRAMTCTTLPTRKGC